MSEFPLAGSNAIGVDAAALSAVLECKLYYCKGCRENKFARETYLSVKGKRFCSKCGIPVKAHPVHNGRPETGAVKENGKLHLCSHPERPKCSSRVYFINLCGVGKNRLKRVCVEQTFKCKFECAPKKRKAKVLQ